MVERDSLMRGSVLPAAGASLRGSRRSGLVPVILTSLRLLARGSAVRFRRRADGNFRPIQQLVEAPHRNHFPRLKTLDGGQRSIRSAGGNRSDGGRLAVFDHVGKSALGVALNRGSRNQSDVVLRVDEKFHIDELAGE